MKNFIIIYMNCILRKKSKNKKKYEIDYTESKKKNEIEIKRI